MTDPRIIKIDKDRMLRMLRDGYNQNQIAKHFGCSQSAVYQMMDRIKRDAAKSPQTQVTELSRHNINVVHQLKNMNDYILDELKRARRLIDKQDDLAKEHEVLEAEIKHDPKNTELVRQLKELKQWSLSDILKIQTNLIALSGEVRKQAEMQMKIFETVYHITAVVEFQEDIVEILRTVDPSLKDAAIKKLKERQSLRGVVKLDK